MPQTATKKALRLALHTGLVLILLLILSLALLLTTLSFSVPPVARYIANNYGVELDIQQADIQVFSGSFSLSDVRLGASEQNTSNASETLAIQQLDLHIAMGKLLLDRQLIVNRFSISDAFIPVRATIPAQVTTGGGETTAFSIAGINPDNFASSDQQPAAKNNTPGHSEPLAFAWNSLTLQNIVIDYRQDDLSLPLRLQNFSLGALDSLQPELPTPFEIAVNALGIELVLDGQAQPLAQAPGLSVDMGLDNIDIEKILTLATTLGIALPDIATTASGMLDIDSTIAARLDDGKLQASVDNTRVDGQAIGFALAGKQSVVAKLPLTVGQINLDLAMDESPAPINWAMQALMLDKATLVFDDESVDPPVNLELENIILAIDSLASAKPKRVSAIQFSGDLGSFGKLQANAKLALLNPDSKGEFTANGEQINLSRLSAYAKQAIGKHIDSGALDFSITGTINEGHIDSLAKLQAHQLTLTGESSSAQKDASSEETELGMPVDVALNLLRDKDDTIRLELPVSGALDNPDFGINQVINKALFKTVKTAVLTQFGPLMALTVIDKAISLGDALKLKPVNFPAQQVSVEQPPFDRQQLQDLDKLAKLLDNRPKIKLNICGYATLADLDTGEISAANNAGSTSGQATEAADALTPDEEQTAIMREQAEARSVSIKNYLVEQAIDGKRLVLCAPRIDDNPEALPRVEFSL